MVIRLKKNRRWNRFLWELFDWSKVVLTAFLIAFFISNTLIVNAQVPTGSMESTIMTGSRILINRLAYLADDPQRGDIISFYPPYDHKNGYLKRVIALPGETIEGIDGKIYIDGAILEEPYIMEEIEEDFGPFLVPEDSYFVMGDNRNNSWDARFWDEKFITKDDIIGRAEFEYYPQLKLFRHN